MRDLDTKASGVAEACIVGNLAGVVEWANAAFARLSGIGLDETVDKPVGRLLERAGIDLEIVEFVAQHFFEGRVCRVAFPFERPDGRRLDVLLEVEALRDAVGEIDRFRAIAREEAGAEAAPVLSSAPSNASTLPARSPAIDPSTPTGIAPSRHPPLDLNAAVRRGVERALGATADGRAASRAAIELSVEVDLTEDLEHVAVAFDGDLADLDDGGGRGGSSRGGGEGPDDVDAAGALRPPASDAVAGLVAALLEAARLGVEEAGNAGGGITLSTARLAAQRRFVSKVHPIAACPAERSASGDVVLEVHDTGLALPPKVVAALGRGDAAGALAIEPSPRIRALAEAGVRARALGARIHLDSTPGCGSQLLVLFAQARPASPPSCGAPAQAR